MKHMFAQLKNYKLVVSGIGYNNLFKNKGTTGLNLSYLTFFLMMINAFLVVLQAQGHFLKKVIHINRGLLGAKLLSYFLPVFIIVLGTNNASAQCASGTAAGINWDIQYFQVNPPTGTDFMFGVNSMKLNYTSTINGVNATNTAAGASYGAGSDMQFTAGNTQTITLTFVDELQNVKFAVHDIDNALGLTVTAVNAAAASQTVTMTKLSGTVLTVSGATATTTNTGVGNASTDGTVNVEVVGIKETVQF